MYKYAMYYIGSLRGVETFEFYADSIELAKDHARMLCNDWSYTLQKVRRVY